MKGGHTGTPTGKEDSSGNLGLDICQWYNIHTEFQGLNGGLKADRMLIS
jgi:hypothetical protein